MKNFALLCIALLTSSAQAGFISLNLWQKGNQKVVVLGDQYCDIEMKSDQKLWPDDKKHWFVLHTCLGKINSRKNNPTALLVDAAGNDFREEIIPHLNDARKSLEHQYIGMHMQLNELATTGEYKSIKTMPYDLRDRILSNPRQFIKRLKETNEYLQSVLPESNQVPKKLIIKEMINSSVPEVTIKDYLGKLARFETEHKTSNPAIEQAMKFFVDHTEKNNSHIVRDTLWQVYAENDSVEQFSAKNDWIMTLNDLLATVGIKKALPKALNNHQSVLLYAGQAHAVTANQHMKELGYAPVVSAGKQKRIEAPEDQVLSPDLLEEVLNKFRSDQTYCICEKPAEKICARCKEIYYCSKECQTSDWKYHKVTCTKK